MMEKSQVMLQKSNVMRDVVLDILAKCKFTFQFLCPQISEASLILHVQKKKNQQILLGVYLKLEMPI